MTHCPHCHSSNISRNKIENMPFDTVARGVLDAYKVGKVAHAFSAAAVWGLVEIASHVRSSFTCNVCRRTF